MIEEPEIIKELREEERIGKLYRNQFGIKDRIFKAIGFKNEASSNIYSEVKINSYKDELDLAKKVYKNIDK